MIRRFAGGGQTLEIRVGPFQLVGQPRQFGAGKSALIPLPRGLFAQLIQPRRHYGRQRTIARLHFQIGQRLLQRFAVHQLREISQPRRVVRRTRFLPRRRGVRHFLRRLRRRLRCGLDILLRFLI